jgi:DNA-directed RNA polymerase specialized sigma subunit
VKVLTKRYANLVDISYEDLLQEGYLAAMNGIRRWQKYEGQAAITAWAWIYVVSRYKELSVSGYSDTRVVSYEDIEKEGNINATDLYINKYFTDETEKGSEDLTNNNQNKQAAFMFLNAALTDGYGDIIQVSKDMVSSHEIASKRRVTTQRINQLNRKIENLYFSEDSTCD